LGPPLTATLGNEEMVVAVTQTFNILRVFLVLRCFEECESRVGNCWFETGRAMMRTFKSFTHFGNCFLSSFSSSPDIVWHCRRAREQVR